MPFFLLLTMLSTTHLLALNERFITRIQSISWSSYPEEAHILKFQNSRVALIYNKIDPHSLLDKQDRLIEVEVSSKQTLISIREIDENDEPNSANTPFIIDVEYHPTILENRKEAEAIFSQMRSGYLSTSQSYERAHVWAYEQNLISGLYSMKAFVFFSDKFIRKNTFKWWFYVSPYVSHMQSNRVVDTILDKSAALQPLSISSWIKNLIGSSKSCDSIEDFASYTLSHSENECFLLKTAMYYWHPLDLVMEEQTGIKKVTFFDWEISSSFQKAFGINY